MSLPIGDDRYDHFVVDKGKADERTLCQIVPKTHGHTVEDYPRGYPRLAAFVSSDIEGRIYRQFGYLRSRLLLYYQDEL